MSKAIEGLHLEFIEPQWKDSPERLVVKIGYAWTEAGRDDLHIQFERGSNNHWPKRDEETGNFIVRYRGKLLQYRTMSFVGSAASIIGKIEASDLEELWESPNR